MTNEQQQQQQNEDQHHKNLQRLYQASTIAGSFGLFNYYFMIISYYKMIIYDCFMIIDNYL